jgi:hypothetical protein
MSHSRRTTRESDALRSRRARLAAILFQAPGRRRLGVEAQTPRRRSFGGALGGALLPRGDDEDLNVVAPRDGPGGLLMALGVAGGALSSDSQTLSALSLGAGREPSSSENKSGAACAARGARGAAAAALGARGADSAPTRASGEPRHTDHAVVSVERCKTRFEVQTGFC